MKRSRLAPPVIPSAHLVESETENGKVPRKRVHGLLMVAHTIRIGTGVLDTGGAEWQDEKLRQARFCTPYAPGCEIATSSPCAEVAELADALHSGCSSRQGVEVRVLSSAPILQKIAVKSLFF